MKMTTLLEQEENFTSLYEWSLFKKKPEEKKEHTIDPKEYPKKLIAELKKLFNLSENKDIKNLVKLQLNMNYYKDFIDGKNDCIIGSYKNPYKNGTYDEDDFDRVQSNLKKIQKVCNQAIDNLKDTEYKFDWSDAEVDKGDLIISDKLA